MEPTSDIRSGMRAAVPLIVPTLALGVSFGVLAEPVMGQIAPIVMSIVVCSGGAQFAALSVLLSGGAAAAAVGAGMLMNTRWLPMSFAVAPSLAGSTRRRALEAQAIVDASFVLASRADGTFDRGLLIGATLPQVTSWVAGGGLVGDPGRFGLDAVFPAFYLSLLAAELRQRGGRTPALTVALASLITLALLPSLPPGLPIIAASAAALIGLRR